MLRISGRTKLLLNVVIKIIVSILVGCSSLMAIMCITYKPVYKVLIDGNDVGYIASKASMERKINEYVLNGDADNVAYVVMNSKVDYELMLLKKDIQLEETKILTDIKDNCDVYYKVYAVNVAGEEKGILDTYEEAEKMMNSINEGQKNFTKQAEVEIIEKNVLEYNKLENVELAVADIMKPLQKANNEIVSKRVTLAASKTVSKEVLDALKEKIADLNFMPPVENGVITSKYGWRSTGYHYGLDIAVPTGTPIYVAEDGIVTYSAWCGNYGYLVKVQHAGLYETYYAHCSKLFVSVGSEVKQGDLIAYVGSTGRSTGPHVHFETRYDGKTMDPQMFIYN